MKFHKNKKLTVSVLGLGYVGLPLALAFSKFFNVIGFDNDKKKINQIKLKIRNVKNFFIKKIDENFSSDIYIVTVPTPLKKDNKPDLSYLINATKDICKSLKPGNLIIYESTVYPGTTEEVLIPLILKKQNLYLIKIFLLVIVQKE